MILPVQFGPKTYCSRHCSQAIPLYLGWNKKRKNKTRIKTQKAISLNKDLWIESHSGRISRCRDRFVWLSCLASPRRSRQSDTDTGKLAFMSCVLRPVLLEHQGAVPKALIPFFSVMSAGPQAFLGMPGVRTHLTKGIVGRTTNTNIS